MATLSSLVETIAEVEGVDPLQVGWIARQLREAELIRKGGRGRGGARMSPADAANLLIGVNATASPKEAISAVNDYRALFWKSDKAFPNPDVEAQREDPFRSIFRPRVAFGDVLEKLIWLAMPVIKPVSELEAALAQESLDLELDFIRPFPKARLEIAFFEAPRDEEDLGEYYQIESGFFLNDKPLVGTDRDRTDRVRITQKTLLEVGKALAS